MKKPVNMKKFLILNVPYVFLGLFFTKIGQAWRLAQGTDLSGKMLHIPEGFKMAFQSFLPSFHPVDILVGVAFALIIRLIVYVRGKNAKKFRKNEEYGSARWGTQEDIAPYILRKLHIDDPLLAQKAVKEGLSIEPNDSDLHFMMAYFLARHGNLAAAQNYVSTNREYILPEHRAAIQRVFDGKPMNEADMKSLMHF